MSAHQTAVRTGEAHLLLQTVDVFDGHMTHHYRIRGENVADEK